MVALAGPGRAEHDDRVLDRRPTVHRLSPCRGSSPRPRRRGARARGASVAARRHQALGAGRGGRTCSAVRQPLDPGRVIVGRGAGPLRHSHHPNAADPLTVRESRRAVTDQYSSGAPTGRVPGCARIAAVSERGQSRPRTSMGHRVTGQARRSGPSGPEHRGDSHPSGHGHQRRVGAGLGGLAGAVPHANSGPHLGSETGGLDLPVQTFRPPAGGSRLAPFRPPRSRRRRPSRPRACSAGETAMIVLAAPATRAWV